MSHYPEETIQPQHDGEYVCFPSECPDLNIDWVQHLREHGWAIVKNVVSKERCEYYHNEMWKLMGLFGTGIKREDRETWKDANWPAALHGGLMHGYGIGHQPFVWEARLEPGVLNIFSTLWGTEELLVSFDGFNLSRPRLPPVAPWHHSDCSGYTKGFSCVQGILNLLPNGPEDGGLIVLDKSHMKHEEFFKAFPNRLGKSDFVRIRGEELKFYEGCEEMKICVEPGDFIVFDSRTIHHARGPSSDNVRAAMYICMAPRSFATPQQLLAKQQFFREKRMTSHWPHKVSDSKPPADELKPFNDELPVLSERAQKLAGLIPYH